MSEGEKIDTCTVRVVPSSLLPARGNSSKTRPGYDPDSTSVMLDILAWLHPGLAIIPSMEQLVGLAAALEGDDVAGGLATFVATMGRWPAPREKPLLGYVGDVEDFTRAGNAAISGLFQVKQGKVVAASVARAAPWYFGDPAELAEGGVHRLPVIPAVDRRSLAAWATVAVNRFMISEQRFVSLHRKTHPRPVVAAAAAPRLRGHAGPSDADVARVAALAEAAAASAVDSQPYDGGSCDEEEAEAEEDGA